MTSWSREWWLGTFLNEWELESCIQLQKGVFNHVGAPLKCKPVCKLLLSTEIWNWVKIERHNIMAESHKLKGL